MEIYETYDWSKFHSHEECHDLTLSRGHLLKHLHWNFYIRNSLFYKFDAIQLISTYKYILNLSMIWL